MKDVQIKEFKSVADLRNVLASNYIKQVNNYFGNDKLAMKFLSSVVSDIQRNPELLKCEPTSVINSYMTMAQLGFMPSNVSGEAYVLPYNKGQSGKIAQFQLGYQGLVTLFYKAGVEKIRAGIVREQDKTTFINGDIVHEVDITKSKSERGAPVGAYVVVTFKGEDNTKYMNGKDILEHAKKFSKSYDPNGKYSPWNPDNDPELTMWTKTVLKQHAKLLPKNESINIAIAEDNKDSIIADRLEEARQESKSLSMGSLVKNDQENRQTQENQDEIEVTEDIEAGYQEQG